MNRLPGAVRRVATLLLVSVVVGCSGASSSTPAASSAAASESPSSATPVLGGILFDDFSYASPADMAANGWIIRNKAGWPGVPGAIFDSSTVKIVDDGSQAGNRLLQMTATSDGMTTHETQICQQRKYREGTFGARVFFNDAPASGPDGDQIVESFYLISPYVRALDPDYSEIDNEYLPNGGWGGQDNTFYVTTWATVQIEPWSADNASNNVRQSLQGWHTLVMQVANQETKFYLDGQPTATHGSHYYPDVPMSLNFNLWFINGGFVKSGEMRNYQEQVDWVYHKAGAVMSPEEVTAAVAQMRGSSVSFKDTVPASGLESPCDL